MADSSVFLRCVAGISGAAVIATVSVACSDGGSSSDEAVTNTDSLESLVTTPDKTDDRGTTQGLRCFKNVNERNAVWVRIQAAIDSGNKTVTPDAEPGGQAPMRYKLDPRVGGNNPALCFTVMRSNESLTPPPKYPK